MGEDWLASMNDMLQTYQRQKRFTEAAKVAATMFDAFPDQHQIAYIAGQLYFRNQDPDMALYYHRKAIGIEPDNVNYLLMAARSYYTVGQLQESVQILKKVTRLAPQNSQAQRQLERITMELNNAKQ